MLQSGGLTLAAVPIGAATLVALLLLLGVVAGAFELPWRRRGWRRGAIAACGHCGYAVTGLTTFTCPECGSDLREVGIVRGRDAPPPLSAELPPAGREFRTFFRVVGWQMAAFAAAFTFAAYFGIDHYVERVRPTTWVKTQVVQATPWSRSYKSVTVRLTERFITRGHRFPPGTTATHRRADVEMTVGPNRFTFAHDVFSGTNTYLDARGVEQSNRRPLSDELAAWMTGHGVDAARPAVRREVDAIADSIAQSAQQGAFWDVMANRSTHLFDRETAYGTESFEGTPPGTIRATLTWVAVAAGLAGLPIIWLLNRRRLALALGGARRPQGSTPPVEGSPADVPQADVPAGAPVVRTLSVMFTDVKDYTARTAGESRLGVLDLVRRHRDLVQPIVKRRGGRVVKSLGDGLLVTFESATDAVLAGLEIQAAAAAHRREAFAERDKLELRIGVCTGEVAFDGGDVFGDAVNLASRAQQQAAAGDVLFTEATCATINRREVQFVEAGTFELKGVPGPVRLYRAAPQAAVQGRA